MDRVQLSRQYEGWLRVPPLIRINGKAPLDQEWTVGPRRDPEGWRRRLEGHSGNVGMLTGESLVVVDVDLYHPGAEDALDELVALGLPRDTVTVLTGRGGRHFYYRATVPIPSRPLDGYPGIDIKADGGMVVVPYSQHPDTGQCYEFEFGYGLDDDYPVAALPEALVDLFAGRRAPTHGPLDDRDEHAVNLLLDHFGAHSPNLRHAYVELTRPGKERGASATVGAAGRGATKVWSSNWPGLPAGVYGLHELRKRAGLPDHAYAVKDAPAAGRVAPTLADLFDEVEHAHDWLIDELLERGDRTVLTGIEGGGKSTLLRQIAIGGGLGRNTLSNVPFVRLHEPFRTLVVDCENSRLQLRREFDKLRAIVGDDDFTRLAPLVHLETRTEGLVLDIGKDPTGDRAWLEQTIAGTRPDLLIIGPLYKMLDRDPTEEAPSRDLAKWLDALRGTYGFALILEAHSPHGEKRPYGWSGWRRWPEFGIHLGEDGTLTHWRGQREERAWPEQLRKGVPDGFPWTPSTEPGAAPHSDPREEYQIAVRLEVLRVMRTTGRPLTFNEVNERVDRRRSAVQAVFHQLRDEGTFIVTEGNRMRENGRPYRTELFAIDPNGPQSA